MYHYESCGLSNVYLRNGYEVKQTAYGEGVSIIDLEGLHRALARKIISSSSPITKDEFKFLRKELDLSQSNLGKIFDVDESTIRNWETGRTEITKLADFSLRCLFDESLHCESVLARSIKDICNLNREIHKVSLSLSEDHHWSAEDELQECA
jgi:DNA-binding transcriptional regulator YiaG